MKMVVVKAWVWDVVAFAGMVMVEACTIGLTIMTKTVRTKGMSPFVFVFYSNALATLIVLFSSIFCHRSVPKPPPLSFSLVSKFFLLGLTGSGKLDLRSPSSQAKAIGTLISVMGATLVILYKGPPSRNISLPSPSLQLRLMQHPLLFASVPEHWVLGALFFALASLSVSIWNVIQAIFGSVIRSNIQGWCIRWKGPVYVAMFKPFGVVVAVTVGFIFFGSSLHVGSVVGAIIMAIGYYSLMWGQIKEEEMCEDSLHGSSQPSSHKVPLLEDDIDV